MGGRITERECSFHGTEEQAEGDPACGLLRFRGHWMSQTCPSEQVCLLNTLNPHTKHNDAHSWRS